MLICILFLFLIVLIIVRIFSKNPNDIVVKSAFTNTTELQTGDLLFVSYNNILGNFMKVWSGSKWTHTAMAYRAPDQQVYVMETANYHDRKGVLFLPIADWYRYNKKSRMAVMKLNGSLKEPDNLLTSFSNINEKKLDTFGTSWFRFIGKKEYSNLNKNENITCYELVVNLLQENGVVEKDLSPSSYLPSDIIECKLPMVEGFSYDNLTKFVI